METIRIIGLILLIIFFSAVGVYAAYLTLKHTGPDERDSHVRCSQTTENTPIPHPNKQPMTHLKIEVFEEKTRFQYGGNMNMLAKAVAELASRTEEFLLALITALSIKNDKRAELESSRLGTEMIEFITKQSR